MCLKVGIFGGTFNPPHIGHVRAAADAAESLALDVLFVVPAGIPPHKNISSDDPGAGHRLKMTQMAFGDIPQAVISEHEIEAEDISYTVDTAKYVSALYPDAQLFLLVGTDMFLTLGQWKDASTLLGVVTPAVFSRGKNESEKTQAYAEMLKLDFNLNTCIIEHEETEISSTELRELLPLRQGCGYIPDTIYEYIIKNRLYGTKPDFDWLRGQAHSMLAEKRVPHVIGCESEAVSLAERYGCDLDEAREAAILHDITKKFSTEQHHEVFNRNKRPLKSAGNANEKLYHAETGALFAREAFGVSNEVFNAILWHTTGKPNMTLLEKIIYIADYIEPTRDFDGVCELRRLAYSDIDEAMLMGLKMSIDDMQRRGIVPEKTSSEALEFLLTQKGKPKG